MWISNAEHAGVFLVMANVDPSAVSNLFVLLSKQEKMLHLAHLFVFLQGDLNVKNTQSHHLTLRRWCANSNIVIVTSFTEICA